MPGRRLRGRSGVVSGLALLLWIAGAAGAGPAAGAGVAWGDPEVIATGVTSIPGGQGSAVIHQAAAWHVIYLKDGAVRYAWRDGGGWHEGPVLAAAASLPRNPHLGLCGSGLIAVWDATSTGAREVMARRGVGASWAAVEMLTNDGVRSQAPVVGGYAGNNAALVAWEDSTSSGFRVVARLLSTQGWGPVEAVSTSPFDAREPSLTADPSGWGYGTSYSVAWTDWRHGDPEIYRRDRADSWQAETRLTDLAVPCRRPCALLARGGDLPYPSPLVTFEATGPQGGALETWIRPAYSQPRVFSADDGAPSTRANAAGFYAAQDYCGLMPVGGTRARITWSDEMAEGAVLRSRWSSGDGDGNPDSICCVVPSAATLGAGAGTGSVPWLQVWTDLAGGVPALLARAGTTPDCIHEELVAPWPLMVAPGGEPPTRLQTRDACSGEGVPGWVSLAIDPGVYEGVVLDDSQSSWINGESGPDGWFSLPIFGGGCSQSGTTWAESGYNCMAEIQGAKSPDIDGDCAVTIEDRVYVEARLGTHDFCADLDHSGLVDTADLAVVDAVMGDICPMVVTVEEGEGLPVGAIAGLTGRPNPARSEMRLILGGRSMTGAGAAVVDPLPLAIYDAAGREVRRLAAERQGADWAAAWDLCDDAGRRLPAGCYFARTWVEGREHRSTLFIIR